MAGRLSLVGTPIGNLGDITLRAVECLRDASRIYAEDTRRSRVLLNHLQIEGKQLLSLHAHSSERAMQNAVDSLLAGEEVAMITDAGMPSVSDPGTDLVRAARDAGVEITVLPGASAVTAAVALSGLVDGPFSFLGFLPRKGKKRRRALSTVAESPAPFILFESPHRVQATLEDLKEYCGGERQVAICREVTKKFEETIVASLAECCAEDFHDSWLGEFTLVVEKSPKPGGGDLEEIDVEARALELLAGGASVKDTAKQLLEEVSKRGEKRSRRELYALVLKLAEKEAPQKP